MNRPELGRAKRVHPHAFLWEGLESDPSFVLRSMFGAKAAYLDGNLMLCFSARKEPWSGILVCTDRSHHASLMAEFPALSPHPVLPKWLYLSESSDAFERVAERLIRLARARDSRMGVSPVARKRAKRPQPKALTLPQPPTRNRR